VAIQKNSGIRNRLPDLHIDSICLNENHNDWDKIVDKRTLTFEPAMFDAYAQEALKKEIEKLEKNAESLAKFKESCK